MLYIHILTINDFQGGVKCALVCVFFEGNQGIKKRGFIASFDNYNIFYSFIF